MNCKNHSVDRLFQAILSLQTVEECYCFFEDACTIKEILDLAQRFDVACDLLEKKNYQQIAKDVGVSTATISRVNRAMQYGNQGYQMVIERLEKQNNE